MTRREKWIGAGGVVLGVAGTVIVYVIVKLLLPLLIAIGVIAGIYLVLKGRRRGGQTPA